MLCFSTWYSNGKDSKPGRLIKCMIPSNIYFFWWMGDQQILSVPPHLISLNPTEYKRSKNEVTNSTLPITHGSDDEDNLPLIDRCRSIQKLHMICCYQGLASFKQPIQKSCQNWILDQSPTSNRKEWGNDIYSWMSVLGQMMKVKYICLHLTFYPFLVLYRSDSFM